MGHQEMSDSAREVLLALTGLAGAVLIAALVTPFFSGRGRRSPIALFEGVVVAVAIISAVLTADTALTAVYDNEPISGHVVSQIARPLVFGVLLLIVLALASRLFESSRNIWTMAPWFGSVLFIAFAGGLAIDLNLSDRALIDFLVAVLVVGALISWGSWRSEVWADARAKRLRRERAVERWRGDYDREERKLSVGVPGAVGSRLSLRCWAKGDRLLLDGPECRQLIRALDERWDALDQGRSALPAEGAILTEVRVSHSIRRLWRPCLEVRSQGREFDQEPLLRSVYMQDGFFDVTEVGIF
jgi:hypothetical protein